MTLKKNIFNTTIILLDFGTYNLMLDCQGIYVSMITHCKKMKPHERERKLQFKANV
jgi:hypothetical protein